MQPWPQAGSLLQAWCLQRGDSSLARRLLAQDGALASLGEVGNEVVELASHFDVPQINGRRIGLLLQLTHDSVTVGHVVRLNVVPLRDPLIKCL